MADPFFPLLLECHEEITYNAVVRMLRADTPLQSVFGTGGERIVEAESERLAVDGFGTYTGHNLLVCPGPVAESRVGSGGLTDIVTAVDLILLTPMSSPENVARWLRHRIFNRVKIVLMAEQGTLRSGDGELPGPGDPDNRISEAQKRFDRLDFNGRLRNGSSVFVTSLRVSFLAEVDETDRKFNT